MAASKQIVVCIDSFAAEIPGLPGQPVFLRGSRIPSDHPAVKANPDYFAPDGIDDVEANARRQRLYPGIEVPRESHKPATQIQRRIKDKDAVVDIRTGARLAKNDPAVKADKDAYVDVLPRGATREDCLLATQTMIHEREGEVTTVYAGQLVPKSHPLVALHPILFERPHHEED